MKWVILVAVVLIAVVAAVTFNPAIEADVYGTTSSSKPAASNGSSVF